jgi:hypothetical protein
MVAEASAARAQVHPGDAGDATEPHVRSAAAPWPAPPAGAPPEPPPPSPGAPAPPADADAETDADADADGALPAFVEACIGGALLDVAELPLSALEARTLAACHVLLVAADDGRLAPGAAAALAERADDEAQPAARARAGAERAAEHGGGAFSVGASVRLAAEGRARVVAALNPSPQQVVAAAPIAQVHVLFAMLGLTHVYVTDCGELIGEITRDGLSAKLEQMAAGIGAR